VRSFFGSGEVIEFVVDVEQALSKSSEFATSLVTSNWRRNISRR
jgi:hypothetical protein